MRILGNTFIVISYIQGMITILYAGIFPLIGGIWTWGDWGIPLIVGLSVAVVFDVVGYILKELHKKRNEVY